MTAATWIGAGADTDTAGRAAGAADEADTGDTTVGCDGAILPVKEAFAGGSAGVGVASDAVCGTLREIAGAASAATVVTPARALVSRAAGAVMSRVARSCASVVGAAATLGEVLVTMTAGCGVEIAGTTGVSTATARA
jgi:hypothetical protein